MNSGLRPRNMPSTDGTLLEPQGQSRSQDADRVRDAQRTRHEHGDPSCFVSVCFETHDRHCDGHLGVTPETYPVLLTNVPWNPKAYRERMMLTIRGFNVPARRVAIRLYCLCSFLGVVGMLTQRMQQKFLASAGELDVKAVPTFGLEL